MTSRLPRLGKGKLESCSMSDFSLDALLGSRRGEDLDLWARTINPQFVRVLRTIGFDRTWRRAEGAYLFDDDGNRYLDMLGGFGMYNVGRNNPLFPASWPRPCSSGRRTAWTASSSRARAPKPSRPRSSSAARPRSAPACSR